MSENKRIHEAEPSLQIVHVVFDSVFIHVRTNYFIEYESIATQILVSVLEKMGFHSLNKMTLDSLAEQNFESLVFNFRRVVLFMHINQDITIKHLGKIYQNVF